MLKPIIKWAGGKKVLIPTIKNNIPNDFNNLYYVEPFVGGGSVFMNLCPTAGIINDINFRLIDLYNAIKYDSDELIVLLENYQRVIDQLPNTDILGEYFYKLRKDFNSSMGDDYVRIAALMVALNRLGYNGLYRENLKGEFNTPFGKKKPGTQIYVKDDIISLHKYLSSNDIQITCGTFEDVILSNLDKNSFYYMDPPYDGTYTDYNKNGFNKDDQVRLAELCREIDAHGNKFMLSNSDTELINDLYKDFNIQVLHVTHSMNRQKAVPEVLITNY